MNEKNLKPVKTKSEARERGRNGGIASGIARRERRTFAQIYGDFLAKDYDVKLDSKTKKRLSGEELVYTVVTKILVRADSSSVSMLKEIRTSTEGDKQSASQSIDKDKSLLEALLRENKEKDD